tara:strand:- start:530 stop:865 length:336 start_codon:yes stop_codon:yes gene_type:complete
MAFDVITPYKLGQSSLTAVVATVHTVPTLERTIVKTIDICNTNTTSVTVIVYLVPSGDSATTSNILIPGATITAKGMFQWGGAQVLNTGDTIQALSSTSGVNINVSGAQCT